MSYKNQHFSKGGLGSDCRPRQVPTGTMARSTQKQSLSLIRAYSPHARVRVQVTLVTLLSPSRLPLVSSGGSFWAFLGPAGKMALRRPLGGQSGHFWGLLAKWLSGGLWGVSLGISGACWQNGSQEAFGGSFWAFLGPAGKMALRGPLGGHSGHFWSLLAKWLSGGLWGVSLGVHLKWDLNGFQRHRKII